MGTGTVSVHEVAAIFTAAREKPALVHCLTNAVVMQWTANVLLAAGMSPAMVDNDHEAGDFAAIAQAVLVNLGTPQADTVAAMFSAVKSAGDNNVPWVLDPVAAGALRWRTETALRLLDTHPPAVVRANASEIIGLVGTGGGRGVDATHSVEIGIPAASYVAQAYSTVVAMSGPVDVITDGTRTVRLAHGHQWLTLVTGAGCSLGALMAGYCAATTDPLLAAVTATAHLTLAAERAAAISTGPGTFAIHLIDTLHSLTAADLEAELKLS